VRLILMNYRLAACRLDPWQPPPQWALTSPFFSITRSADELSVICDERDVPPGQEARTGIAALRLASVPEHDEAGILSSLLAALADSGISVLAVSTYETDFILISAERLTEARAALRDAGHEVEDHNTPR
jgi:uncharacterized protein